MLTNPNECPFCATKLQKLNLRGKKHLIIKDGGAYELIANVFCCPDCKRIFTNDSKAELYHNGCWNCHSSVGSSIFNLRCAVRGYYYCPVCKSHCDPKKGGVCDGRSKIKLVDPNSIPEIYPIPEPEIDFCDDELGYNCDDDYMNYDELENHLIDLFGGGDPEIAESNDPFRS